MLKSYLDSKKIKYDNTFVDDDEEAAKKMIAESGQMGVPFTEITKEDGSVIKILGFDQEKINEALGISA
jgi:glutaredoxin